MTRVLLLLAVLAACGPASTRVPADTTVTDTVAPALAPARSAIPQGAQAAWVDTTRYADSIVIRKGRSVTTVIVDSSRTILLGTLFGPMHLPAFGPARYTGAYYGLSTTLIQNRGQLMARVRQARAARKSLIVNLVPRLLCPDTTQWISQLTAWRDSAVTLAAYADSGTIRASMLVDEPYNSDTWLCGPTKVKTPWTNLQLRAIARAQQRLLPNVPRCMREDPVYTLTKRNDAQLRAPLLTCAIFQYEGKLHAPCAKDPEPCFAEQAAAARTLGLKLVGSLNIRDGGDGSSRITNPKWATDPNPNDSVYKDARGSGYRYEMSNAEILRAGLAAAAQPNLCALIMWSYSDSIEVRARAALDSLTTIFRNRPLTRCA